MAYLIVILICVSICVDREIDTVVINSLFSWRGEFQCFLFAIFITSTTFSAFIKIWLRTLAYPSRKFSANGNIFYLPLFPSMSRGLY